MMSDKVTKLEVQRWLGSDTMQECIEIIIDVANNNYESEQLYKDIKDYAEQQEWDDD